jgi:phage tail-like protein
MASYYPPTGFHFRVEFQGVSGMDNDQEQRFNEVNGLSFEVETESMTEGGENRIDYKLPKRIKYSNLVLKRGLLTGSALIKWINDAMNTFFTVAVYDFQPADIIITLLDESGNPVAVWKVMQAYPVKWNVSNFNSSENAIAVETIELAYQYFERLK